MQQNVTEELVEEYAKIDIIAEEILTEKHQIVDLDAKRNKCREAARSLRKQHPNVHKNKSKSWVCFGNTFIKIDTSECISMLESDQKTLDKEIDDLRDGLKPKVAKLHKMEGRAQVKGFELKGMRVEEVLNLKS